MRKTIPFILIVFLTTALACHHANDKAKSAINKTGEVVAEAGSEFVDGVGKGIEKAFQNELVFSEELKSMGIKTGKMEVKNIDGGTDNLLVAYFIFDKDFDKKITVKVLDKEGLEYGRTSLQVKGKSGEAGYYDFVFDKRTNIDGRGKITFE